MENNNKDTQLADTLLTITMTLLNGSVLFMIAAGAWLAYSMIENSTALTKIINGSFLR